MNKKDFKDLLKSIDQARIIYLIRKLKKYEVKADNKEMPSGWYVEIDDLLEAIEKNKA